MFNLSNRSFTPILVHILLWITLGFVLLFYQPLMGDINMPYQFWVKQSIALLLLSIIFYLNNYLLVPRLLLKNRTIVFILVALAICVFMGIFMKVIDSALDLPMLMQKAFNKFGIPKGPWKNNKFDIFQVLLSLLILGASTSVALIQKWQQDKQFHELLEKERISTELSFLKAQINPHFFFNTLNNIYALTHIDIDTSRKALHKLSRMMRYLLYDTQQGYTPLSKEISFIVDYIELMKLRLNDNVEINFSPPLLLNDPQVAPMLFLPYIENAFKYGISTVQPSKISIDFTIEKGVLEMRVVNTNFSETTSIEEGYGGIGLNNTKRRLDLLYPDKYSLSAMKFVETNQYIIYLTLTLE